MIAKVLYLFLLLSSAQSIMFHLPYNSQKCLREEIKKNDFVSGEFEVSELPGQKVDYVVTDSKQHILSQQQDVKKAGKFSFVTENQDVFEICFKSRATHQQGSPHEVSLNIKRGVEAKNYEGLEDAAKLKPMEVELRKLEELSVAIVQDFEEMKKREQLMRDTNESTNSRVLYLSIFSMMCLLGLAVWQVLYLRKFFRAKKLIE